MQISLSVAEKTDFGSVTAVKVHTEVDLGTVGIFSERLRHKDLPIRTRPLGQFGKRGDEPVDWLED
jgi:hypothetical protein